MHLMDNRKNGRNATEINQSIYFSALEGSMYIGHIACMAITAYILYTYIVLCNGNILFLLHSYLS